MAEAENTNKDEEIQGEQWFRVCLNTIVRAGEQLDSERLRILPMGSRVCVTEKAAGNSRRVKIKSPIKGWCSMSSSNGDTILAPIENPTDIPNTPKNPTAKLSHLQNRLKQTTTMLEAAQNGDDAYKGKVDENKLEKDKNYLEKRVNEASLVQSQTQAAYDDAAKKSAAMYARHADQKYVVNDIVMTKDAVVGVIRWIGNDDNTATKIAGLEVQQGSGDCDGTYKPLQPNPARHFEVKRSSGLYVEYETITRSLSAVTILSQLEKNIAELANTREAWASLTNKISAIANNPEYAAGVSQNILKGILAEVEGGD